MTKTDKIIQLLELVGEVCQLDQNFFARGHNEEGNWVAWVLMRPDCQPMVYLLKNGGAGGPLEDMTVLELDLLLKMEWQPGRPAGVLDLLARQAAGGQAVSPL